MVATGSSAMLAAGIRKAILREARPNCRGLPAISRRACGLDNQKEQQLHRVSWGCFFALSHSPLLKAGAAGSVACYSKRINMPIAISAKGASIFPYLLIFSPKRALRTK
jgi:hypothetical protein